MSAIEIVDAASWNPPIDRGAAEMLARRLESGAVILLPRLAFDLAPDEQRFLDMRWSNGRAKNISLDGTRIKGARGSAEEQHALARMVARFAEQAAGLVGALFPRYRPYLVHARTSFRPMPAAGRDVSWRKDDTRLHVDAFPSRPNRGERILRVFNNANPEGKDRVWRVGEPFEAMARRFLPRLPRYRPLQARALAALRVTKGVRSEYDHLMLALHDAAKADLDYQRSCAQEEAHFRPGSTWVCFSDQVMHAAMSGQYMFEQTIHLPIAALHDPLSSPIATLERLRGRPLAGA